MSVFSSTTFSVGLLGRDEIRRPLDPVLVLAADPGRAEVDQFHLAVFGQHDVGRLQIAVIDPAAVHVRQRRRNLAENQHELAQLGRLDLVEGLAVDVFQQELDALDLEPRLFHPAIKNLGDGRMVELLGGFKFGHGLLDVDLVFGLLLANHLQGVAFAAGRLVADQEDRAPRTGAERVDHAIFHARELGRTGHIGHAVPRSCDKRVSIRF